eukprot:2556786-Pleurochrysis_carterae.AAC.1
MAGRGGVPVRRGVFLGEHGHRAARIGVVRDHSRLQSMSGAAQEAMEIPGETTNAGVLQESGKRSTRSYIDASFPADFAML